MNLEDWCRVADQLLFRLLGTREHGACARKPDAVPATEPDEPDAGHVRGSGSRTDADGGNES